MQLEISDMELENLNLKGSLLVEAERPMGHLDQDGLLCYSDELGSCILKNIKIENRGVDWMKSGSFWKNQFCRKEAVRIVLKGHSRFIAENVEFYGAHEFIVPDGVQMRVIQEKNKIRIEKTKFTASPIWTYTLQENRVKLRSNVSE
jgi:hypothetical protein